MDRRIAATWLVILMGGWLGWIAHDTHVPRNESSASTGDGGKQADVVRREAVEPSRTPRDAATPSASETLRRELIEAGEFLSLYRRLSANEENLAAHEAFYLAWILETCAFGELIPDVALQGFEAGIRPAASDGPAVARAKERVARRNVVALCDGVPAIGTEARIAALFATAAEGGDARAIAWRLQAALDEDGRELGAAGIPVPAAPSPAQREALLQALQSRDPMAIAFAGRLLTRGYESMGVAFGNERITPSLALHDVLWDLVACDFGAECGPHRLQLDHACASSGRCGSASYYDFLQRHVLTPQDLQDYARIQPHIVAGIRFGDWSGVHFLGSNPGGYVSAGRRRFALGG